jgi:hypothetical protein
MLNDPPILLNEPLGAPSGLPTVRDSHFAGQSAVNVGVKAFVERN